MPAFICTACGTQYPDSAQPPAQCKICEEERQYVPPRGQTWTTLQALRQSHSNTFRECEPGVQDDRVKLQNDRLEGPSLFCSLGVLGVGYPLGDG